MSGNLWASKRNRAAGPIRRRGSHRSLIWDFNQHCNRLLPACRLLLADSNQGGFDRDWESQRIFSQSGRSDTFYCPPWLRRSSRLRLVDWESYRLEVVTPTAGGASELGNRLRLRVQVFVAGAFWNHVFQVVKTAWSSTWSNLMPWLDDYWVGVLWCFGFMLWLCTSLGFGF